MFVPLEAEERGQQRLVRWISLDGSPSSGNVSTGDIFRPISIALFGEDAPQTVCDLSFLQRI